jgi:hypothetical protein
MLAGMPSTMRSSVGQGSLPLVDALGGQPGGGLVAEGDQGVQVLEGGAVMRISVSFTLDRYGHLYLEAGRDLVGQRGGGS